MSHNAHDDHDGKHHLHVTPFWPMLIVFVILLFLTALTVVTAKQIHVIPVGNSEIVISETAHLTIAMLIACLKGALVLGFFMHLLYDKAVNSIILASSLFGVVLFIGLTLMDLGVRDMIEPEEQGEIVAGGTDQIVEKAIVRGEAAHADEAHDADNDAEGAHDGEDHDDDDESL